MEYTQQLKNTFSALESMYFDLFGHVISLSMSQEWKEVNNQFSPGDIVDFKIADFKNISDQNIHKLLSLMASMDETLEFLKAQNNIAEENTTDD